ncbi:MAG: DUF1697 domain-containing protein [Desertimonas sp.]
MARAVYLLRGINVGGRSVVKMADLRAIATGLGFEDVETYVQSGNLIATVDGPVGDAGERLREAIAASTSVAPAIASRTAAQMRSVVERCPFDDTDNVHVSFLVDGAHRMAPTVHPSDFEPEKWAVGGRQTYLLLPDGIGRSKLAAAFANGRFGAASTVRNWRTVSTIAARANS